MTRADWYSIIGGALYAAAYIIYLWPTVFRTAKSRTKPNPAMWVISSAGAILSCATFGIGTGSFLRASLQLVNIGFCFATALLSLRWAGERNRLSRFDWFSMSMGAAAVLVWCGTGSVQAAYFVVIATTTLSFVPTWHGIWRFQNRENPLPWFIWTTAYVFQIAAIHDDGKIWVWFAMPVICIFLHLSVAFLQVLRHWMIPSLNAARGELIDCWEEAENLLRQKDYLSQFNAGPEDIANDGARLAEINRRLTDINTRVLFLRRVVDFRVKFV